MTENKIRAQREKCPDCGGQLQEVAVRQNGQYNTILPLTFGTVKPKALKFLEDRYEAEGVLLAFMCSSCARVAFYGAAKKG